MNAEVPNATIQRALRLLEYQKRASQSYYARNREAIKTKSLLYWEQNRETINERRRQRYRLDHPAPEPPNNPQLQ
jgi:hypothetical protein